MINLKQIRFKDKAPIIANGFSKEESKKLEALIQTELTEAFSSIIHKVLKDLLDSLKSKGNDQELPIIIDGELIMNKLLDTISDRYNRDFSIEEIISIVYLIKKGFEMAKISMELTLNEITSNLPSFHFSKN